MPNHTIATGECLTTVAKKYGLPWTKIWDHGSNAALRSKREDPNILHPGDKLFVPDKELDPQSCATGSRHSFKLLAGASKLRVRLRVRDAKGEMQNVSSKDFVVEFDKGEPVAGQTDGNGLVNVPIPIGATSGKIIVEELALEIPVDLGCINPLEEVSGAQGRLRALGYPVGPVDGIVGDLTRNATRAFQADHKLSVDGIIGPQTRAALKDSYGS
ncbi:peptidoglycan-binding protein [Paraglaciecola arctica]|uniref:peptidoglycan-binding protein n=1 Tax=Paraglaciecola arctica TaxID=1128911 RepID=UPI001C074357|nr:peptidoglycan-binding protein [Paraglaciecola arctica]MBU3004262.1 peptidoglycan-binding protein [Paraglaciecola arctica]